MQLKLTPPPSYRPRTALALVLGDRFGVASSRADHRDGTGPAGGAPAAEALGLAAVHGPAVWVATTLLRTPLYLKLVTLRVQFSWQTPNRAAREWVRAHMSLTKVAEAAAAAGVPVLVDAAADYPVVPRARPFLVMCSNSFAPRVIPWRFTAPPAITRNIRNPLAPQIRRRS